MREEITPQKHVGEITQICLLCTLFTPLSLLHGYPSPLSNKLQTVSLVFFLFFYFFAGYRKLLSTINNPILHLGFIVAKGFDLVFCCP